MSALGSWLGRGAPKAAVNVRRHAAQTEAAGRPSAAPERERVTTVPKVVGPADAVLTGTVVALVCFGVVMVYSASAVLAYSRHDNGQHFLVRQAVYALLGVFAMLTLARFDYHNLRRLTYPLLLLSVCGLALTAFHGKSAGGAARWIELGPVHIQPAEIAKVTMIFWLSHSLSKKSERIRSFWIGFVPHVVIAGVVIGLCLLQPDFGSAVMVALMTFVLLFTAGAHVGYMLGGGFIAALGAYFLVTQKAYRMKRIAAFLSPFELRYHEGYQVVESLLSFGAGGMTGVGLGDSRQKLFFLPEAHTDFISAIIGEELGFVGLSIVIAAFLLVSYRGIRAAYRAADDYGTYLAAGITLFIGLQAFTNLAVALGLLPTKGLVLPFVSFGGSALLVNCAAVGVLLNVSRARAATEAGPQSACEPEKQNVRVAQTGGIA
jgi:cell division protein FtsW